MYDATLGNLVGKTIEKVFMDDNYLKFKTDDGTFTFTVEGDCCSHSYFHDFIGLDKLLNNGKVILVGEVNLSDDDPRAKVKDSSYDDIKIYGYEIVTEDPKFGPVTTVFSFRNSSNGYYGGWMHDASNDVDVPEIKEDKLGD